MTNLFFLPLPTGSHQKKQDLRGFHTSRKKEVTNHSCQLPNSAEVTPKKGQELIFSYPMKAGKYQRSLPAQISIKLQVQICLENSGVQRRFLTFMGWIIFSISDQFNLNQLTDSVSLLCFAFCNHNVMMVKTR